MSEAAQKFRLNMGLEPQLVSGTFKTAGSETIEKITNKLDDLAGVSRQHVDDAAKNSKNFDLNNSLDDVVKSSVKHGEDINLLDLSDTDILKAKPKNSPTPSKWLEKGGKIEIDYSKIPPEWIYTDWEGNIGLFNKLC